MIQATYTPASDPIRPIEEWGWRGVVRAVVFYHTKLLETLNVPNTGEHRGGRTVYPHPSQPGEPPRKRTGFLQKNVTYQLDEATHTARVGVTVNAIYGVYLELSQNRPWLVSTLVRFRRQIEALASGGG